MTTNCELGKAIELYQRWAFLSSPLLLSQRSPSLTGSHVFVSKGGWFIVKVAKDAQAGDVRIFTVNYGGRQGMSFKFHFSFLM